MRESNRQDDPLFALQPGNSIICLQISLSQCVKAHEIKAQVRSMALKWQCFSHLCPCASHLPTPHTHLCINAHLHSSWATPTPGGVPSAGCSFPATPPPETLCTGHATPHACSLPYMPLPSPVCLEGLYSPLTAKFKCPLQLASPVLPAPPPHSRV